MKHFILILIGILILGCKSTAQNTKMENKKYKITKSNEEWAKALTPKQYHVLREAGTEYPGTSEYNDFWEEGIYVCAGCETPLYESGAKFNAHCGWPSFDKSIKENIELDVDYKIGYARTELKCKGCGGHLGHVFDDGPTETGKRHCLNGIALKFIPSKK